VSDVLKNILKEITDLEASNRTRPLLCDSLTDILLQWGGISHRLRMIADTISKQEFIDTAIRLSKLLSVLITQVGIADDYMPLPEVVLSLRHNKKFDITEADSVAALVYCSHKVIECLAILATQEMRNSAK
jgi:hypothetical protein